MKPHMILMSIGMFTTVLFFVMGIFDEETKQVLFSLFACPESCNSLYWFSVLSLLPITWLLMVAYLWVLFHQKKVDMRAFIWAHVAYLIVFIGCVYALIFGYLFILTLGY